MKYKLLYISSVQIVYLTSYVRSTSLREGPGRARRHDDECNEEAWMSGLNQRFTKPSNLNRFREFESHRLRIKSEFKFPQKIWSARSAVCSEFPPKNPDSERIRHAPRGSKSMVRAVIIKFEPTFLNK